MSEREAEFAVREDADGSLFLEPSLLVPYGEQITGTPEFGSATEEFEMGAFRDHPTVVLLDRHNGKPISGRLAARETAQGWITDGGRLMNTEAAREFVASVREGVVGPSIEFDAASSEKRRTKTGVSHTRVKRVAGAAATYRAAYSGSFAVRHMEGSNVAEDTTEVVAIEPEKPVPAPVSITKQDMAVVAQRITDEAIRNYAAASLLEGRGGLIDPFTEFRGLSFGQLAARAMADGAERGTREWMGHAIRTFADTVTTSANAGVLTPGVVGDVAGIVSRGRPAITAFGGPRPIPDVSGMSIDWPYYDGTLTAAVGAQSADKVEITSVAMNIKKGTEPLLTFAGGSDISYQLLRRSTVNYLDVYFRILLTAWGVVTDAAFVTELESGSVTQDMAEAITAVDATEFKNGVIDASIAVETATGLPAEFVLASTTAFTQFAKLFTPEISAAGIGGNTGVGSADFRGLRLNVGNLPVIHVPSITAGKLIVSNREAAAWFEDGPFQVQDEDVIHLGRNVAIWSMGAGARFIPAGIVEYYDVTP